MIIDNVDFVMFDRLYIVIARSFRKVYTVNPLNKKSLYDIQIIYVL